MNKYQILRNKAFNGTSSLFSRDSKPLKDTVAAVKALKDSGVYMILGWKMLENLQIG